MAGEPGLHERAREQRALTGLVEQAAARRTTAVFIEGEAGMGASLAASVAGRAAGHRFEIHRGRAHWLDRMRPFTPMAEAFGIGERPFIGPRTVEAHPSNVVRRLGPSSRVELAAAAEQEDEPWKH